MKRFLILTALLSLGVNECGSLPYKADIGLMSAIDANSFELKFNVQDLPCKDLQGKYGKCVISLPENDDLFLKLFVPPGPGSVRIYIPNRETLSVPFRDQKKPLEIKLSKLTMSNDGTIGISVIVDETQGAIQALVFLTITKRDFVPLESIQINSKGTSIEVIASPSTKWLGLIVGNERVVLEKANKISFDSEGKRVEVESFSEILRTAYSELAD